jgi:hypothetical protein
VRFGHLACGERASADNRPKCVAKVLTGVTDKPTPEQYTAEVVSQFGCKDFAAAERNYTFNMRAAHQSVNDGATLRKIVTELRSLPVRYAAGRPHLLFFPPTIPPELDLQTKPFKSALDKLYRSNILYNRNFPKPPRDGGIEPPKLYEGMDDLIRTRLVCKYMDGPRFVCEALVRYCGQIGVECKLRELSTEAGYYAWHFYVRIPVELMLDGSVVQKDMWVEVQITTQLAEVITALTHELYEARRSAGPAPKNDDWKWDAGSHDFRSAYLGHGLHLLEGIIQNLKDDLVLQPPSTGGNALASTEDSPSLRETNSEPKTSEKSSPLEGEEDV